MTEVVKKIRDNAGARPVTGEEFQSIMRNMTSRLPGRFETLSSLEGAAIDLIKLRTLTKSSLSVGRRFEFKL